MLSMTACKSVQEWLLPAKPLLIVRWAHWTQAWSKLSAKQLEADFDICRNYYRYLGTTPDSSSLAPLLTSICQQLSYTFMLPFEDIPDDLVPLTAHMKELLNQVQFCNSIFVTMWWMKWKCISALGNWVPTPHDMPGFRGSAGWFPGRQQNVMDAH